MGKGQGRDCAVLPDPLLATGLGGSVERSPFWHRLLDNYGDRRAHTGDAQRWLASVDPQGDFQDPSSDDRRGWRWLRDSGGVAVAEWFWRAPVERGLPPMHPLDRPEPAEGRALSLVVELSGVHGLEADEGLTRFDVLGTVKARNSRERERLADDLETAAQLIEQLKASGWTFRWDKIPGAASGGLEMWPPGRSTSEHLHLVRHPGHASAKFGQDRRWLKRLIRTLRQAQKQK